MTHDSMHSDHLPAKNDFDHIVGALSASGVGETPRPPEADPAHTMGNTMGSAALGRPPVYERPDLTSTTEQNTLAEINRVIGEFQNGLDGVRAELSIVESEVRGLPRHMEQAHEWAQRMRALLIDEGEGINAPGRTLAPVIHRYNPAQPARFLGDSDFTALLEDLRNSAATYPDTLRGNDTIVPYIERTFAAMRAVPETTRQLVDSPARAAAAAFLGPILDVNATAGKLENVISVFNQSPAARLLAPTAVNGSAAESFCGSVAQLEADIRELQTGNALTGSSQNRIRQRTELEAVIQQRIHDLVERLDEIKNVTALDQREVMASFGQNISDTRVALYDIQKSV